MSRADAASPNVHVELRVDAPYGPTPVHMHAWSNEPFALQVVGGPSVVACERGVIGGLGAQEVQAEGDGSHRHVISVTLADALRPEPIFAHRLPEGPQSVLGNRWYPFNASRLRLDVRLADSRIGSFALSLGPDLSVRTGVEASAGPGGVPERRSSYEDDRWRYALWWPEDEGSDMLGLNIPLQITNSVIARDILGGVLSLAGALAVIAVGGHLDKNAAQLTAAGLGAYLVVLVRQWIDLPHVGRFSALAWFYLVCGLLTIPWAIGWGHHDGRTWWELLVIVPWIVGASMIVPYFQANGRPPPWYAVIWRAVVRCAELSRDVIRDSWELRGLLSSFEGEGALLDRLPDGSICLRAPRGNGDEQGDALLLARRDYGFEITRDGRYGRATVFIYSGWSLVRAVEQTGADATTVQDLVHQRNRDISALRSRRTTDRA